MFIWCNQTHSSIFIFSILHRAFFEVYFQLKVVLNLFLLLYIIFIDKYQRYYKLLKMTEVDDTLKRIQSHKGVVGTIVINGEGVPIRSTLDNTMTVHYAAVITEIIEKTRNGVRDLDPTNELTILRIRTKKHEIMIAPDSEFMMIVIQEPVE
ncbi:dynein light chain roadblock-type 2 isoform X2 [Nilaparvata lugens]|uniref:dynein light chain roadblock-type 2 isoform X2 n=1 Tax=Nilaparvata lugens TaxID=108931 RepID=UPI00193CC559|nr:dynein light chain roadblock-type 2 isoform X2 [Nilaparvata lugens]